ncbi:hypothetical protein M405DRAFT_547450 [Rhizopogon salebrosus TDB-379]|nr:hypothetical protein M405DRAFT_547450 [Rhizopogon salebrosus TDB-379]
MYYVLAITPPYKSQAGTLAQKAASAFVLDIDTAQPPSDTNTCTEDIRPPLTNADSTSFLDADATQPPSDTLPEGFFSDIHVHICYAARTSIPRPNQDFCTQPKPRV